jgi:hypothetical protein
VNLGRDQGLDVRAGGTATPGRGARPSHAIPFPLVTISGKPVQYKGDDLDPERGPGLGCFRFQLVVLVLLVVLTPLSVVWQWPDAVSAGLLFAVIILLLITGQTIIFLLRLVAADRRGRRRPLASTTPTVGELEDGGAGGPPDAEAGTGAVAQPPADESAGSEGPVRQ